MTDQQIPLTPARGFLFDASEVARLVTAQGVPAYIEHTGGGCFTIFAGPEWTDGEDGPRATAVAGPVSAADNPAGFVGDLAEFYVGPDTSDEDVHPTLSVGDLGATTARDVADLIVLQVLGAGHDALVSADVLDTAGFDSSGRGVARQRPSRSYALGLPVVVTVFDDGAVEFAIDHSEAPSALLDDGCMTDQRNGLPADPDQIIEDAARVSAWLDANPER